jgi:isoleucyl-tRNA synthetase
MKERLCQLFKTEDEYEILKEQAGRDLVGLKYVPMFDYFVEEYADKAFMVRRDASERE